MVTSILGLAKCTLLETLKIKFQDWHLSMKSVKGISELTNLHTLSISWKSASSLDMLKPLVHLRHLDIVLNSRRVVVEPICLEHMHLLETLSLETNSRVSLLPVSLKKLKLVFKTNEKFSFDLPLLESLEFGGCVHRESVIEMLKKQKILLHFAFFAFTKLSLDLNWLSPTVKSLEINETIEGSSAREFENLHCVLDPILLDKFSVTKSVTFRVEYFRVYPDPTPVIQLIKAYGHLRLSISCSYYFDLHDIVEKSGCTNFLFNGMLVTKDEVVVRETHYPTYYTK